MKKLFIILALILLAGALFLFTREQDKPAEIQPIPISFQQTKKDEEIKAVIDSSKKIGSNLEVTFHHNSTKAEPVSILGAVRYNLSKTSASPGEKTTLTVYNWTSEYFEIKIGANSDHFAFGKKAESLDNDEPVLKELQKQGINKADVVLEQDYAPRVKGNSNEKKSPYSKTYKDTKSGKYILVTSGLPQVTDDGAPIDVGWSGVAGNKFVEKNNLFKATVDGTSVELVAKNDGADGKKKNDKLSFHAQLFLNNVEKIPTGPTLLAVDPINSNYQNNVLEWDYGIAKRRLRLIEGSVLGSWVFPANPNGDIRIKYNQTGDYKLKLGRYKFNDDEERVSATQFNSAAYPFEVSDSATYYPDANPETTSVDGWVGRNSVDESWATIIAGAGTIATDSGTGIVVQIAASGTNNQFAYHYRGIMLFDTSGLPDTATVSAATLSLYGYFKRDDLAATPNLNIYTSTPTSNTALANGDYGQIASTAQSTFIAYADFSTIGYNDFALNDMTKISLTGVSKFGARNANYDVAASAPPWVINKDSGLFGYASEQGDGYKPKLVVTYDVQKLGESCTVDANCAGEAGLICRNSVCCKSTIAAGDSCAVYYPDADAETTSVDGSVYANGGSNNTPWVTLIAQSGSGAYPSITSGTIIGISAGDQTDKWYQLRRSIYLFDTSGLNDSASVTTATLSVYGSAKSDALNVQPDINIYSSTPATNTNLVAGDYSQTGGASPTAFSTAITYTNWSTTGYNDFTFNASGISAITATGVSKFSARNANLDVAASSPTWAASVTSSIEGYFSEQGTGYKPRLYVEYNIPPTPTPTPTPFPQMNFEGVDMEGVNIN